ncbi:MAG: bifunctional glutamine synthetase adenylyltransferase/deadenyltransferase, partial [Gammaproteobacteria bacterium]|nr:bifunctional glutamine synthetase adenylyltransferase/deadenyltransferase [Gammaproteobacteria bacterium]
AAADISEVLPLMQVSDHLSWIAEVVLEYTLAQAWEHMVSRHGKPRFQIDGTDCDKGFAIIGYGKLGGLELGYGSDLDLVFVHGADDTNLMTDGPQPVAASVFYARLGQRIIHLLTAHTPAGVLYEVDMRLRPDGASGMLVTSLKSFNQYQREKAWTWEHQALVRARFITGDPQVAEKFSASRQQLLGLERQKDQIQQDVLDMREKMRKQLDKSNSELFDLKQGAGGIVDIEFMVQYGVLVYASKHAELLTYTDNIRLLMILAAVGVMSHDQANALTEAYRVFRGRLHRLKLDEQSGLVAADEYLDQRQAVIKVWQQWLLA